ncbi:hypothetical protein BYT27DRAFT_7182300 [Phlegmacium glaucopus]|nr:hypothetical protein BYT27DRAFT_7182300 [Phlegmacium glaucopus]
MDPSITAKSAPNSNTNELWMIGIILSAVIYGGILSLSISYVPLLLTTSQNVSRRIRNFLLVYTTFMVAISTLYLSTTTVALTQNIFREDGPNPRLFVQIRILDLTCITLANWGADGFMLWRCAMLCVGVSQRRRIALIAVLVLLALLSLASGIVNITIGTTLPVTGVTVVLNIFTAIMITFRIIHFERYMRKAIGMERNSPYTMVVIICVESSALIIVFSLIYLILDARQDWYVNTEYSKYLKDNSGNPSYVPLQLLVNIYVLSPLLIIYRVTRGKPATVREQPSESVPSVSPIHFELQPISSGNIEV